MTASSNGLFCYGTLQVPEILFALTGKKFSPKRATLFNYRQRTIYGEHFPGIVKQPSTSISGLYYQGLTQGQLAKIDEYEGSMYSRSRVTIYVNNRRIRAWTYRTKTQYRKRLGDKEWNIQDVSIPTLIQRYFQRRIKF